MSSTTERRIGAVARTLGLAAAIAAGWLGANAGILAATERADAVLVVFARPAGAFALPESVAILAWNGRRGRFVGNRSGYVADLYRAGALMVLPARGGGCLAMLRRANPFVGSSRQDTDGRLPAVDRRPAQSNDERT